MDLVVGRNRLRVLRRALGAGALAVLATAGCGGATEPQARDFRLVAVNGPSLPALVYITGPGDRGRVLSGTLTAVPLSAQCGYVLRLLLQTNVGNVESDARGTARTCSWENDAAATATITMQPPWGTNTFRFVRP